MGNDKLISAVVAKALLCLIALVTNLAFFQRLSVAPVTPQGHHLGWSVVVVPVVARENEGRVLGYLGRGDILAARLRHHEEEELRETGPLLRVGKEKAKRSEPTAGAVEAGGLSEPAGNASQSGERPPTGRFP